MNVLEKLITLKKQNNWTDYRIAKESGLSHNTIANIFSGSTLPRIDTLEQICNAFGLTLAQFFLENERYVFLTESQLELFQRWDKLSKYKKEKFTILLDLILEDNEHDLPIE